MGLEKILLETQNGTKFAEQLFSKQKKRWSNPSLFWVSNQKKKSEFEEPLFSKLKKNLSLLNHFSATFKITSKGADEKVVWLLTVPTRAVGGSKHQGGVGRQ